MRTIKDLLINPFFAIQKAKKDKNVDRTMSILMISWVMISLSFFVTLSRLGTMTTAIMSSLIVFIFGVVFNIFCSYIIDVVMNVLGGKGNYFGSLTATSYSSLPFSIGVLITALLAYVNPILGAVIGFVALSITVALSFSLYFRSIKEFYSTDMVMAFLGFLVIIYVLFIAMYVSVEFSFGTALLRSASFGVLL